MNTKLSAVVNLLAKLNDSGVDSEMTDLAQNQRHVKKNVSEKLTDEEAEKMIKETDVDNAQWNKASICQWVKVIPQERASE